MAVSLSTNAIKLYGPATGQYLGDCLGHTNTVSDISFPDASSPNILCSSSADGTVRAWDIRLRKEVTHHILCTHVHETGFLSFVDTFFLRQNLAYRDVDAGGNFTNRKSRVMEL